jgi:hypothetical protein
LAIRLDAKARIKGSEDGKRKGEIGNWKFEIGKSKSEQGNAKMEERKAKSEIQNPPSEIENKKSKIARACDEHLDLILSHRTEDIQRRQSRPMAA